MSIVRSTLRAGTRDLPDVPPCVQYLIGCFLTPILAWLTTLVYRQVLTRCADHPLLLIAQHYDLRAVVTACAAYQHRSGPGAPPTFSVDQLVRAELVRAWAASCTDPELEWLLASNLIVRWFVGLPLVGPTPDHRTLNRLHAWMATTTPTILFADLVTFLDQVDPQPAASTPQIVDTFARASPAAPTVSVIDLLGQLLVRLVAAWPQTIPCQPCWRPSTCHPFAIGRAGTPPMNASNASRPSSPPLSRRTPRRQMIPQRSCGTAFTTQSLNVRGQPFPITTNKMPGMAPMRRSGRPALRLLSSAVCSLNTASFRCRNDSPRTGRFSMNGSGLSRDTGRAPTFGCGAIRNSKWSSAPVRHDG